MAIDTPMMEARRARSPARVFSSRSARGVCAARLRARARRVIARCLPSSAAARCGNPDPRAPRSFRALPLCQGRFSRPIYTHGARPDLARILLKDAGFLNEKMPSWTSASANTSLCSNRSTPRREQKSRCAVCARWSTTCGVRRHGGRAVSIGDAGPILGSAIARGEAAIYDRTSGPPAMRGSSHVRARRMNAL